MKSLLGEMVSTRSWLVLLNENGANYISIYADRRLTVGTLVTLTIVLCQMINVLWSAHRIVGVPAFIFRSIYLQSKAKRNRL